ncbi:MAG: magnesium transporter CorA family protein [Solirubrobacterales bacterium]|nr:magnesium transporter CorA family protein [Solirubrobacterales bacterium]
MRFLQSIDRDEIAGLLKRDEYFWLDLRDPGEDEAKALEEVFSFHPLALEDMLKRGQRPKLDDFGEYMFLVYYGAGKGEGDREVALTEVHAFLSGGYIVTAHLGPCPALMEARKQLEAKTPRSEQFVIYRVLDGLTDSFFPVLDGLDERMEGLDQEIFERPAPAQLEEITALRRELVALRRIVTPQRDLLARGVDDILEIPGLEADSRNYFRDVYDHAIRISDQIDSYRDLLAGTRDAYLSVVSNRLNQITKQLTVVATIFLPLSFIVGFFGQNFKWLVEGIGSEADFLVLGIGSLVASVIALVVWFRRGSYI